MVRSAVQVDDALMEHAQNVVVADGSFAWDDLGSWTALHEHHVSKSKPADGNRVSASGSFAYHAKNNYVHSLGKFVALVGVSNLVIVETEDALLITTLDQSQDVGKVVKHLDEKGLKRLT